ncbi:MAG TPA: TolC family protein [Acidisarcina sp.]
MMFVFGRVCRCRKLVSLAGAVAVSALAVALTGCLVGPNYKRASAPAAPIYKELAPPADGVWQVARPSDEAIRGKWWEIFGDSQLDVLEEKVAVSNQTLRAASERYLAAREQIQIARADLFPTIGVGPTASRSQTSLNRAQETSQTKSLYNDVALEGQASWEPDFWGRVRRNVEAVRASTQASAADLANAELSVRSELALDYFQLRGLDVQKQLLDDTLISFEKSYDLTVRRFHGGVSSDSDVELARTQLESTRAQDTEINVARSQYEHAIATLIGEPASSFSLAPVAVGGPGLGAGSGGASGMNSSGVVGPDGLPGSPGLSGQSGMPARGSGGAVQGNAGPDAGNVTARAAGNAGQLAGNTPGQVAGDAGVQNSQQTLAGMPGSVLPVVPVAVPSLLLERRPDIAAAERRMQAANAQIGVAKAAYYPNVSLNATGGFESSGLGTLIQGPAALWSLGGSGLETVFDAGRRRSETEQAEHNYEATVADYRQRVLAAFQDVEDNLAALRTLQDEAESGRAAVAAAQRSLDLSVNRYKGGVTSYLEVLTAQSALLANQRNYAGIEAREFTSSVLLVRALGGSWDVRQLPRF